MRGTRRRIRNACALSTAALAACGALVAAADPPATEKRLRVFDLDEKPAFPLPAHLEQRDIAAGSLEPGQLVEAGGGGGGRRRWRRAVVAAGGGAAGGGAAGVRLTRRGRGRPGASRTDVPDATSR